ncbi:hypothetical protein BDR22DRAFT_318966 [Usnea florida]
MLSIPTCIPKPLHPQNQQPRPAYQISYFPPLSPHHRPVHPSHLTVVLYCCWGVLW